MFENPRYAASVRACVRPYPAGQATAFGLVTLGGTSFTGRKLAPFPLQLGSVEHHVPGSDAVRTYETEKRQN